MLYVRDPKLRDYEVNTKIAPGKVTIELGTGLDFNNFYPDLASTTAGTLAVSKIIESQPDDTNLMQTMQMGEQMAHFIMDEISPKRQK